MLKDMTDCFNRASLATKIKMIMVWYWDEDDKDDLVSAIRGIKLAKKLSEGRVGNFTEEDWYIFYDALGSFGQFDNYPEIASLYKLTSEKWGEAVYSDASN